jgi:hypothetical protein
MDPLAFDPQDWGVTVAALVDGDRCPELGPGTPNERVRPQLAALTVNSPFSGREVVNHKAARCCLAGLWLWHDFLDESHRLSQEIDTAEGSYWHAIMHRREPDYSNAKYWFRRVGKHPIYEPLAKAAGELAPGGTWDPFKFVDLCEAIAGGQAHSEQLARQVARSEWQLLFDHCFRQATGQQ